jgi:hypothetical protein
MKAKSWFFGCLLIVGVMFASCSDATAEDDAVYDEIQNAQQALDKDEAKEEDT